MSTSEALQHEIRTTRPAAPAALRERIRALAAEQPAREPLPVGARLARLLPRRAVLVPVALVVALFAVGVVGLGRTGGSSGREAGGTAESASDSATLKAAAPPAAGSTAPVPGPGRLQDIDAELRLRVADVEALSAATQRAMRLAQSLGGYVASSQYDAPAEGIGGATLTLKIPSAKVQEAITQLSALGTILGQRIGVVDLQGTVDDLGARIVDTRSTIARLERQLRSTTLAEERAVLQAKLEQARATLADLQGSLRATRAEGELATVQLSLTTEPIEPATTNQGRLDRLGEVLVWEGVALLYVLALAGPFVLLALVLWLVLRARRRREEARLLGSS